MPVKKKANALSFMSSLGKLGERNKRINTLTRQIDKGQKQKVKPLSKGNLGQDIKAHLTKPFKKKPSGNPKMVPQPFIKTPKKPLRNKKK